MDHPLHGLASELSEMIENQSTWYSQGKLSIHSLYQQIAPIVTHPELLINLKGVGNLLDVYVKLHTTMEELPPSEKKEYLELVGSAQWIANGTVWM
jgi:hypothetical protein